MVDKQVKSIHVKCLYQYLTHKHNSYSKVFVFVITTSPTIIVYIQGTDLQAEHKACVQRNFLETDKSSVVCACLVWPHKFERRAVVDPRQAISRLGA